MERNTVERSIKTETDTRTEFKKKEWASSVGLGQRHKPQHPHHVKARPRGKKEWERQREVKTERT